MVAISSSSAANDYLYAWRWLLPLADAGHLEFKGIAKGAQLLFRSLVSSEVDGARHSGRSILVCDLANCEFDLSASDKYDFLAVIGPRASVDAVCGSLGGEWAFNDSYALLPSSRPRLAVPLSSAKATRRALNLHRPGRFGARLAINLVSVVLGLGASVLLQRRKLVFLAKQSIGLPVGLHGSVANQAYCKETTNFAVYFGACGDNRKTVALPVDSEPSAIFKTAWAPNAKRSLLNEGGALKALAKTSLAGRVPCLLSLDQTASQVTMIQEYRRRCAVRSGKLRKGVTSFLRELSSVDACAIGLEEWLDSALNAQNEKQLGGIPGKLRSIANMGIEIDAHRCHGDFAPWNVAWSARGVFVFDWEESHSSVPALFDAFFFAAAEDLLVAKKFDAQSSLKKMRDLAIEVSRLAREEIDLYLALWLVDRASKDDSPKLLKLINSFEDEWV